MSFFEWDDSLSVGIPEIDAEHKHWIGFLNELHVAVENETSQEFLCELLDRVYRFSEEHFKHEEDLFMESGYPGAEEHRTVHAEYLKELDLFRGLCSNETAGSLTADALLSLKKWLINHVQEMDMHYVSYVKKHS